MQNDYNLMLFCDRVHPECRVNRTMPHPPRVFGHIATTGAYYRFIYPNILHNNNASLHNKTEIENILQMPPSSIFLCPSYRSLMHPGEAQTRASTLQVVQLGLGDMNLHCIDTRSWHSNRGC